MIELLAPAKDKKCAIAAINYGADAIYIGASEFGARKNVPNSLDDIKEIVEYAHKFRVKVYITLNTILTDDEIVKAKDIIEKLTEIGVDAIIIQDMGLFSSLRDIELQSKTENAHRSNLPVTPPAFHASTQCDNRTPEKVKFLESVGFKRVILARELSIEQIKEIRKQTNVELETFIHGALCVSYSGQCYMSQLIGGRSANRGECAQPCRKKYSLVDEDGNFIVKDKHLLCLKDFNASKHLKELAEAGVTSFKIEGRLKDENYVKNVVAYYRKLIDELGLGKTSSGKIIMDFEPNLEKSFNRGFTDYFLKGRVECFTFDSPKSKGEYLGKVSKVGENYFEISQKTSVFDIHPQDGLCFYVGEELSGCLVNKVDEVEAYRSGHFGKVQKIFPNKMITETYNHEPPLLGPYLSRIDTKSILSAESQGARKNNNFGIQIGSEIYRNVDVEFEKKLKNSKTCRKIEADIEFDLGKVKVTDEDNVSAEIPYDFEEMAQNEEKMSANIINQLKKSGDTDFLINEVKINTKKIPFLPVSKLNELRRELLDELARQRITALPPARHPELVSGSHDFSQYKINFNCDEIASVEVLKQTTKLESRNDVNTKFPQSEIDYRGNVLNQYAKKFYEEHGCKVTEMALESGKTSKTGKVVMTTKHCLKNALKMCKSPKKLFLIDEKGKRYELKFNCDKCEMEIVF